MLTAHVVTLDNSKTIEKCLKSLASFCGRVVVADIGSSDETIRICKDFGAEVKKVESKGDMSDIRNSLISDGMNFYIKPWEFVLRGAEFLRNFNGTGYVYVLEGGVVSKQIRIWKNGAFINPVFEHISHEADAGVFPSVIVNSMGRPDTRIKDEEACRSWANRRPTNPDPYYYLACCMMSQNRMSEFVGFAEKYLSMEYKHGESRLMMNYYMAIAEASLSKFEKAYRRIIGCLSSMPCMAEFWCLAGDMIQKTGDYKKALHMYENAIIIGSRRNSQDLMPIEVSKYDLYPKMMIERCSKALSGSVSVGRLSK